MHCQKCGMHMSTEEYAKYLAPIEKAKRQPRKKAVKMNEYQRMLMYLKIMMCNLAVLHHDAAGEGWFEVHRELDRWQRDISGHIDDLERGIALGYQEATISEGILAFQNETSCWFRFSQNSKCQKR